MSNQRKLNALLFELQTASSPLSQAKILARSWRTLRDLSPTDRRLLARHAGFDGAEQILEGLASKRGGFAPAMLLQLLSNARASDGAAVSSLLSDLQDPATREDAIRRGAHLAADLLDEEVEGEDPQEIDEALEELHLVEAVLEETPEEALAELNALKDEPVEAEITRAVVLTAESASAPTPADTPDADLPPDPAGPIPPEHGLSEATGSEQEASPEVPPHAPRRVELDAGWGDLREVHKPATPAAEAGTPGAFPVEIEVPRSPDARGSKASALSRLRDLHREIGTLRNSSTKKLRDLVETFPDGWPRRRAVAALIGAGMPADSDDALALIEKLERELDRRWCLGVLAERGGLRGPVLDRSLALLSSPWALKRLQRTASSS